MARIPIYQMTYGQNQEGEKGLVFTTEQTEYNNQSLIFTIPIVKTFDHPFDIHYYFESNKFYFPFSLNEEYLELEATVSFPEMIFRIPNTEYQVAFEVDMDYFYPWWLLRRNSFRRQEYVGKFNHLIDSNHGFVILLPVDLYEMDELYTEHSGIFVGLTPNFGNINRERL